MESTNQPTGVFLRQEYKGDLDNTCFLYGNKKISYALFFELINKCEKSLVEFGVHTESKVVISQTLSPEAVTIMLAAGNVCENVVMADVRNTEESWVEICQDIKPAIIFYSDWDERFLRYVHKQFPEITFVQLSVAVGTNPIVLTARRTLFMLASGHLSRVKNLLMWEEFIAKGKCQEAVSRLSDGSGRLYFLTSGTTGKKKYFTHTQEQINQQFARVSQGELYQRDWQLAFSILPLFSITGWLMVGIALFQGKKQYLHPSRDIGSIWKNFFRVKADAIFAAPSVFESVLNLPIARTQRDLSHVRIWFGGGGLISEELQTTINQYLKERGCPYGLVQGYGLGELVSAVTIQTADACTPGSLGRVWSHIQYKIVHPDTLEDLPSGEKGLLLLKTSMLLKGYVFFENGEITIKPVDEWFRTEDLIYEKNGECFYAGRLVRKVDMRDGSKVNLDECERTIKDLSYIRECAFVCIHDKKLGPTIHLVCSVQDKNSSAVMGELIPYIKKYMNPQEEPQCIYICDKLPRTATGKIDYPEVEKQIIGDKLKVAYVKKIHSKE